MKEGRDVISLRQLMVLLFTALLSPWVALLPSWTAAAAGQSAWLTGVVALPLLLAVGYVYRQLFSKAPAGSGLSEIFQQVLGQTVGRALTIIYIVWGLFLLVLTARAYGQRMVTAGQTTVSAEVFVLLLLALVLWMGRKKLAGLARSVEIFYFALVLTLGFVLFFALLDMKVEWVLPVWLSDVPAVASATYIPVALTSVGVYGAFLGGQVKSGGKTGTWVGWTVAASVTMTLLQLGVMAQLGAGLSAQLTTPFFEVARGVGVTGAFQRVESVVIALWGLSDFALIGMILFACRAMVKGVIGDKVVQWVPYGIVGLTILGAVWIVPEGGISLVAWAEWALLGNIALGIGVPILVLLVQSAKIGKKRR